MELAVYADELARDVYDVRVRVHDDNHANMDLVVVFELMNVRYRTGKVQPKRYVTVISVLDSTQPEMVSKHLDQVDVFVEYFLQISIQSSHHSIEFYSLRT